MISLFLTVIRRLLVVLVIHDLKVEAQQVNGDGVFASVVLLASCQEGLREEEARHPEDCRCACFVPDLETTQNSSN